MAAPPGAVAGDRPAQAGNPAGGAASAGSADRAALTAYASAYGLTAR